MFFERYFAENYIIYLLYNMYDTLGNTQKAHYMQTTPPQQQPPPQQPPPQQQWPQLINRIYNGFFFNL